MSLLSKITGKGVLTAGLIGTAVGAAFLLPPTSALAVVTLSAYSAYLSLPPVTKLFTKLLGGFAEVPAWPRFVALGVAALVTAHVGGWRATVELIPILTAMDGNVFDALY